jgi:flavin-binding protein dodecin
MNRLLTALTVAAVLILPACSGGTKESDEDALLRFLAATERTPHAFEYTEKVKDQTAVVEGQVADNLRYQAQLKVNGAEAAGAVVNDDSIAIRFINPSLVPALVQGSQVVADALRAGKWVVDPQAAPPLLAPVTKEGGMVVGRNAILDAVYIFQYARRSINEAFEVVEFNEDDISYQATDDPFRNDKPNREAGVRRYDIHAPFLPRRNQRGTASALPTTANFRWMIFFVREGKVIRIEEKVNYEINPEILRAKRGAGPKYPLTLLEAVREGKTADQVPVRVRDMTYKLSQFGKEVQVQTPVENTVTAALGGLFGPEGFNGGGSQEAQPVDQGGTESPPPAGTETPDAATSGTTTGSTPPQPPP